MQKIIKFHLWHFPDAKRHVVLLIPPNLYWGLFFFNIVVPKEKDFTNNIAYVANVFKLIIIGSYCYSKSNLMTFESIRHV